MKTWWVPGLYLSERSVRPGDSISRGGRSSAADAHPTQFRKREGPRIPEILRKHRGNFGEAEV